ncbi:FHA domain-containing protein [Streptomyces sp. NBC_01591]|uniref:FHA domain-containing protein n=1 Tax=Streptomyces sp. NBC_01591 TaxID=2975888 RepID=UPI002DDA685B|nr:FHA domain-containing protein [Streptomyces sp. NBC_01591]WSD68777.1 FHA domain-containing protein [Streptomyces sp. NBC_01591]
MQIRLTVLAPRSGQTPARACDVLVTAPSGTALATVASNLAAAVLGPDGSLGSGAVVLFAGRERLDAQRCALGEPPLVDGAVLSLQVPGEDEAVDDAVPARLHVVAGPDAGGVHLLHGGQIRIGRSADADVPLDDPDVSRLHCAVTVSADGLVSVADLGSTNGTLLDGTEVRDRPVRLKPGALLRLGESTLRLTSGAPAPTLATAPDGEGHLRVSGTAATAGTDGRSATEHGSGHGYTSAVSPGSGPVSHEGADPGYGSGDDGRTGGRRPSSAARPAPAPDDGSPRRGGIGAWARRLAGNKGEPVHEATPDGTGAADPFPAAPVAPSGPAAQSVWPDPAAVLLTALGPGPRLWERGTTHPEALVVRLGTTDRAELPAVPVTVGLREAGSLGLAGPRTRLAGLARSTVAQLAALHSPADLEIVLISTDRARGADERRREWAWLGWLPHLRPMHGQDCRLLLAYDREQATARTTELVRRLDDGPLGPGWASLDRATVAETAERYAGPYTVVIVDGDPGSAALRENTARLAAAGAAAGIHLICLAETPAATPTSPVAATYEAACHASIAFRECGAVAMLSGDVATALRLLRTADGRAAGRGTVAAVDAVSAHWAERFGRALAPLRTEGASTAHGRPASASLPTTARLLDELGLARATPASLMARWASTADDQPGATVRGSGRWTGGPAGGGTDGGADPDTRGSGRTEYPRGAGPRVGAQRTGGAPGPDGTGGYAPGSGRTPYPGSESATHIGTPGHALAPDDVHDSGRTPYPDSGRTPYPAGSAPRVGGQRYGSSPGDTPSSRTVPGSGTASWGGVDRSGDVQGADSLRSAGSGRGSNRVSGPRGGDTPRIAARGAESAATAGRTAAEGADTGTGTPAPAAAPSPAEGTAPAAVGRPVVVLGAGPRGAVSVDLAEEGPHLLIEGPAGSGRTELLRAVAASLAAAARPDLLGILLVDGAGGDRGEGLRPCTELPHAFMHLVASDPVRMREFAQALGGELKRRAELLGQYDFTEWHHRHEVARRVVGQRPPTSTEQHGDVDAPMSGTLRLRPAARSSDPGPSPLPRLVVLVDDFDALVAPALGSPGRPAAGSVVRALEAVAREGGRLGVHLVAASARPERTEDTDLAHGARLRIVLDAPVVPRSPEDPAPGRGRLGHPDGRVTPFQGGRVTGRIPRTATLRPTVVPLEWERMGDPPTRRPVRELGNGPTDLALLASALERAARSVNAEPIAPFGPVHP